MTRKKPRTPRYWPRMKVRGARRRRKLPMYRLMRIADAVSPASFMGVSAAMIRMQKAINDAHVRLRIVDKYATPYFGPLDAETLEGLGISITEVGSGSN